MSGPKTHYLRVSEKDILPVEIHSVQKVSTDHANDDWLRDRHVQEIIQLLHGPVTSYMDKRGSKQTSNKQLQKPSDIVTGSSVRFGYLFKSRPASQTCLIEENYSQQLSEDYRYRSFHVLRDKLVVFAHPLIPGSPRMSQLMKVLKAKRQSSGQGVSISSYFQKVPSQNALSQTVSQTINFPLAEIQESAGSQSSTTLKSCTSQSSLNSQNYQEEVLKENQSVSSLPQAPPSEGRRNKIKSILERGEIGKARRLQKRRKVNQSDNQSQKSDSVTEVIPDRVSDSCYDSDPRAEASDTLVQNVQKDESSVDSVKVTACTSPLIRGSSGEFCMIGNVHVSRVESPCVQMEMDNNVEGDTVTLISVDQMNEIKRDKQTFKTTIVISDEKASSEAEDRLRNQSVPHSELPNEMQEFTAESMLGNQSDADSYSDSSNEMLELPSASFCTKKARRKSSAIGVKSMKSLKTYLKPYEADVDTDSVTESPKFRNRKAEKEISFDKGTSDTDRKLETECQILLDEKTRNKKETLVPQVESQKPSHSLRSKRKFPTFSDSESDESLPEKRAKTKPVSQKFVNLEHMKSTSKKLQISNSFFTGDGGKAQPTLSFFVSNKKSEMKKEGVRSKSEALRETVEDIMDVDNDIADLDCELIKELSDFPKVKNEADTELKNEIRAMNSISRLNEEHIQYLIRINEKYLRDIFEGKVACERHQEYKKGGNSRRYLNYKSRLSQYTEEQVDTIMESLMAIFCKRHHKYLDYILKVLLPEMLIKLYMDVHGTTYQESEKRLAPKQLGTP